jgi:hypothetical protein
VFVPAARQLLAHLNAIRSSLPRASGTQVTAG